MLTELLGAATSVAGAAGTMPSSSASSSNTINVGGNNYGSGNPRSIASTYKQKLAGTTEENKPSMGYLVMLGGLGLLGLAVVVKLAKG